MFQGLLIKASLIALIDLSYHGAGSVLSDHWIVSAGRFLEAFPRVQQVVTGFQLIEPVVDSWCAVSILIVLTRALLIASSQKKAVSK